MPSDEAMITIIALDRVIEIHFVTADMRLAAQLGSRSG